MNENNDEFMNENIYIVSHKIVDKLMKIFFEEMRIAIQNCEKKLLQETIDLFFSQVKYVVMMMWIDFTVKSTWEENPKIGFAQVIKEVEELSEMKNEDLYKNKKPESEDSGNAKGSYEK